MSCSSVKHHFDKLKNQGGIHFDEAIQLYNDLKGSLDAHKLELAELRRNGDKEQINHLQQHIHDGESMLSELHGMIVVP